MARRLIQSPEQLALLLKSSRKAAKFTQGELAARLGLSANRFSELEADISAMTVARLLALTQALGLELSIENADASSKASAKKAGRQPATW